jgi:hypothetical protein
LYIRFALQNLLCLKERTEATSRTQRVVREDQAVRHTTSDQGPSVSQFSTNKTT